MPENNPPTPSISNVITYHLLIDGNPAPTTIKVMNMIISKEVNRIPSAKLVLLDGEPAKQTFETSNGNEFIPGKKIEIKVGHSSNETTLFKGILISQQLKIREYGSFLTLECRDESIKMTYDRKSKYFIKMKDSELLEEILDTHKIKNNVKPTSLKHKEMVQFESTDWDFMITRCEANGCFCIPDDGEITIAEPDFKQSPNLSVSYGSSILELDVEMDARYQTKSSKALSWNPSDQELSKADGNEPKISSHGNLTTDDLSKALGTTETVLRHSGNISDPELQEWSDGQLLRQRMAKTYGRVKCSGFPDIKPGMILEIGKLADRFEGKVWVSGVRHEVSDGLWFTHVQFGMPVAWHAEKFSIPAPAAGGLLPPITGLHIGVVTKLEKDPDGEDRIQVRLPLISPNDEGTWARIATLDAGEKRGSFFRPELADEVLVGFLNEDPRHPVILGMMNSSAKPAPHQPKDTNHEKGFVTRSGMRIWFDDDQKIAMFETKAGNKITLSEADTSISIQDQNGNKLVMDDNGINIESVKDIILKAGKDIKMKGINIEAKASSNFNAEGTTGATVKASATATLEGGAFTVVKGGMVKIN